MSTLGRRRIFWKYKYMEISVKYLFDSNFTASPRQSLRGKIFFNRPLAALWTLSIPNSYVIYSFMRYIKTRFLEKEHRFWSEAF